MPLQRPGQWLPRGAGQGADLHLAGIEPDRIRLAIGVTADPGVLFEMDVGIEKKENVGKRLIGIVGEVDPRDPLDLAIGVNGRDRVVGRVDRLGVRSCHERDE